VDNLRETVAQTAIRIVKEWRELRLLRCPALNDEAHEVIGDHDIVIAWLLGQDAKQKGGRTKR
jgi:hypothetical protein